MDKNAINNAKERRSQIERIIKNDNIAEGLLRRLSLSAVNYVNDCANMEAQLRSLKNSERYVDEKEFIGELDRTRRNSHEGLISNLNVLNRYLFKNYDGKVPVGGIYSLSPESIKSREAVGDWAGYFVFGLNN